MPRRRRVLLAIAAVAMLRATPAAAQRFDLTVTGGPLAFPTPTATDFQNGYIDTPTGLAYTINARRGVFSRTSTLSIRSTSATLGNGKPLSDLMWRRADLGTWTPMTTLNATVESRQGRLQYSNSILFRSLLSWTATAPATYGANLVLTLSVTSP